MAGGDARFFPRPAHFHDRFAGSHFHDRFGCRRFVVIPNAL